MLYGKRIKLRAMTEQDFPKVVEWRNRPEMYEFFYECEPLSIEKQKMWFENAIRSKDELNFIIATLDDKAIGTVSIVHIDMRNRKAEWGRFLIGGKDYYSGGYGSEVEGLILEYVFEHLNLNRLYCEVLVTNPKVIALHKKFGFKQEGVLRQFCFKQGEYLDVVLLSMLQEEYYSGKAGIKEIWDSLPEK